MGTGVMEAAIFATMDPGIAVGAGFLEAGARPAFGEPVCAASKTPEGSRFSKNHFTRIPSG